jgi:hypothetical protein
MWAAVSIVVKVVRRVEVLFDGRFEGLNPLHGLALTRAGCGRKQRCDRLKPFAFCLALPEDRVPVSIMLINIPLLGRGRSVSGTSNQE